MLNYNFHAILEPLEFQSLVCDIVQLRDDIFLETYKEGRDFGIDGSYTNKKGRTIVQVKRYQPNAFNRLYYDLKTKELPKVRKLAPNRYILGVSMDFAPGQKEKIVELFQGCILDNEDIISSKDINNLLGDPRYKRIELAFPKLWLPSINAFINTMHKTVHSALYKESLEELKGAVKKSKSFVPTRIYLRALEKWTNKNVIILSGEPGVGKTTIAHLLALAYLQPANLDGFVWANSINDIYAMLEDDRQQVFILDDFWGSVFNDELKSRNNENRLNKLIKRIVESKTNKRLILTTREYVLQQGLQKNPILKETLNQYALVCTMEEYGYDDRARILLSHIYTSKLEYEFVEYLYKRIDRLIYHENYNPRVLALFLDKDREDNCSPEDYFYYLCDYFDHPTSFWEDIFNELSDEAKIVSMLLLISSTPMLYSDMEICYMKYISKCPEVTKVKSLKECLAELEKTMIKSSFNEEIEEIILRFTIPAVQDYLYEFMSDNIEQYIPIILKSSAFFNQLQFSFQYFSNRCSDRINNLIIQECITHYSDYGVSYMEYDGSWNWDPEVEKEIDDYFVGELNRLHELLINCNPQKHKNLFAFLEVKIQNYCLTMGAGNLISQYTDLQNIPGIIIRCIEKGMEFDGESIINKYFEEAFSVYHFKNMRDFDKAFPEEYAYFYQKNYEKVRRNLKNTILKELDLLYELDMDINFDMLIDDVPDVLKEFGLRYTKQFESKIFSATGRKPHIISKQKSKFPQNERNPEREEIELNEIKQDASLWLFGPRETKLENKEKLACIFESNLSPSLKSEFKKIVNSAEPHYLYNLMETRESFEILLKAFPISEFSFPNNESSIMMNFLSYLSQNNTDLLKKIIGFCAEALVLFIYQDEPVLRIDEFITSDIYNTYLKTDKDFCEYVFKNLLLSDEQWIRFLHIPLFIFCNAIIFSLDGKDKMLEEYWEDLWGENFNKLKIITKNGQKYNTKILYADIGTYYFKRADWEGSMYRIFEELTPFHFNEFYVAPRLSIYLKKLGNGDIDSKILKHSSICRFDFEYTKFRKPKYSRCFIDDELSMLDHLGITEGLDIFPNEISKSLLNKLQAREDICKKQNGNYRVYVYKIKDIQLLKRLGVYEQFYKFVNKIEALNSRFLRGDFSPIEESKLIWINNE
ncbi:AAA family ATPase [Neobacillus notoginsengisoli]|uniref:AAA family ATPase n=1 Tax=Neobacillus notoginsengisoli TaxID=1578198 RepID=A0A417Z032_9BACI|nr:ATP-binding protein [Neobacillus notoginsengisoli]RHW43510.1 AAA family ATPase [Neobacillus notoginsengisoli]